MEEIEGKAKSLVDEQIADAGYSNVAASSKSKPPTSSRQKKHNFNNIDTFQVVQSKEADATENVANQSVRTGHSRSSRAEKRSRKQ